MEAAKHLLRSTVYLFYPPPAAVIIETLLHHGVLYEDDLVKLCQLHRKVLRAHTANLIHDRLVTSKVQKEDYQGRLFSRTYYFIHFIEAIDAIKWKVHCIVKQMKEDNGSLAEPQGYVCPTCHQKYTLLDAASLLSDDGLQFECSLCGDALIDDDISQEQRKGQEKLEKLMALLEPIIRYLKDIDDDVIEDNNFESSLIKAVPAFANSLASYSVASETANVNQKSAKEQQANANSYYAPSGPLIHKNSNADAVEAAKRGDATIHVSITADDEDLKRERAKREQRNEKLRQNALPSWHQSSTVGERELGRLDGEEEEAAAAVASLNNSENANGVNIVGDIKDEFNINELQPNASKSKNESFANIKTERSDDVNAEEMSALSAYYEQLKQRQEKEDAEDEEMWDMDEWEESGDVKPDIASFANGEVKEEPKDEVKKESADGAAESAKQADFADDLDEDDIDLDMFD